MKQKILAWFLAALAIVGVGGCSTAGASNSTLPHEVAVTVETTGESQPARITISALAEKRLGIQTVPVRSDTDSSHKSGLVVPYAAIVYDADGASWALSAPTPRTYVRVPLEVRSISGDLAQLSSGPPVGTEVVIVGAPELVGAEAGISDEE
jgi:hypothetical protein